MIGTEGLIESLQTTATFCMNSLIVIVNLKPETKFILADQSLKISDKYPHELKINGIPCSMEELKIIWVQTTQIKKLQINSQIECKAIIVLTENSPRMIEAPTINFDKEINTQGPLTQLTDITPKSSIQHRSENKGAH